MIRDAPCARATRTFTSPIGPAPQISTWLPAVTWARRQAWIATDSGSSRAPSSYDTWSGSLGRAGDEATAAAQATAATALAQLVAEVRGVHVVARQRAVDRRRCTEAHLAAQVVMAGLAVAAEPARHAGLDGDAVADTQRADTLADSGDNAAGLVAQHHRRLHDVRADGAVRPVVHVGAADADRAHRQLHVYAQRADTGS